jgi:DDE family transposase
MMDWPLYNESLVRRGQVLLDFDVLDGWDHELSQMNRGKVGEPYDYPNSFIQLLGYMRIYFHLPYRQTQDVVIAHASTKVPCILIIDLILKVNLCHERYRNLKVRTLRHCNQIALGHV